METELVSNAKSSSRIKTYHVFSMQRSKVILTATDVDLSQHVTYNIEEVVHNLCSYAIIVKCNDTSNRIKCYGIREHYNYLVFSFNNYDGLEQSEVRFRRPELAKTVLNTDVDGNATKYKYNYPFPDGPDFLPHRADGFSLCRNYKMKYFCPVVFQLNNTKMTLKVIASRACITVGANAWNVNYSS
jgi:hypothetical protein